MDQSAPDPPDEQPQPGSPSDEQEPSPPPSTSPLPPHPGPSVPLSGYCPPPPGTTPPPGYHGPPPPATPPARRGLGVGAGVGIGFGMQALAVLLFIGTIIIGIASNIFAALWPFIVVTIAAAVLMFFPKWRRLATGVLIVSGATWLIVIGPCIAILSSF